MTTSAKVIDSILRKLYGRKMKMMIYGMGKDVAQTAVAVNGTTHLTSANLHNTTSEDMELRLFTFHTSYSSTLYYYPTVSLIEIFVK